MKCGMMITTRSRQLPVLEGKRIVGIVSRRAVVKAVLDSGVLKGIKVHEVMSNPVEHVKGNDLLDTAVQKMIGGDYRTLPVVGSNDKVMGVVGMKEIIDSNWKASRTVGDLQRVSAGSTIVETVCTTHAVTIEWGDSLADATDLMVSNGFSSLPVVDSSGLVGIVTEFDITELISASRDRDQMYVQISGLEDDDKAAVDAIYEDIEAMVAKVSKIYIRTASRLIFRPSASSPMATLTPPAPKSLHRLIRRVTSLLRNSLWILRSSGALPF